MNRTSTPIQDTKISEQEEFLIIGGRRLADYKRTDMDDIDVISLAINTNTNDSISSLKGIEQLINLESITITGENLDDLDFYPLKKLENLKELHINCYEKNTRLTKIPNLKGLNSLTTISFMDTALNNLNGIETAKNLHRVIIDQEINDDLSYDLFDISTLKELPFLSELVIWAGKNTKFYLKDMGSLMNLKEMILAGYSIDMEGIDKLLSLKDLDIRECEVIENIDCFSKAKELESLRFTINSKTPDISFLATLINLKYLVIDAYDYQESYKSNPPQLLSLDVTPIGGLLNLEVLQLNGFIFENADSLRKIGFIPEDFPRSWPYLGSELYP
jgi:hypothetical protein